MTPDDALERELEALRPRPPSPELGRRIGGRLARPRRLRIGASLAAAAIAAGVVVSVLLHRPPAPLVEPPPTVEMATPPSVLAYGQAFAQSPAALDAMLDEQAVRTSRDVTPLRAGVIADLFTLKGRQE
jgi:hypothetical protein